MLLNNSYKVIIKNDFANQGCRSSADCRRCGIHMNMEGKPGTYSKDGKTLYVHGPCCCGLSYCEQCWKIMKDEGHPETKPYKYVTAEEYKELTSLKLIDGGGI